MTCSAALHKKPREHFASLTPKEKAITICDCLFIGDLANSTISADYNSNPCSPQLFGIFGINTVISEQVLDLVHTPQGSELDPLKLAGVGKQVDRLC